MICRIFYIMAFWVHASAFAYSLIHEASVGGWRASELSYNFDLDSCPQPKRQLQDTISKALLIWSAIEGSSLKKLKLGKAIELASDKVVKASALDPRGSSTPVIICDNQFEKNYRAAGHKGSAETVYAIATSLATQDAIQAAWILINLDPKTRAGRQNYRRSAESMLVLFAHEIGHTLGLHHSLRPQAMMWAGGNLRLNEDDREGIRYLYPERSGRLSQLFRSSSLVRQRSDL